MGAFEYTALDTKGRQKRGILEGDTPKQVRQLLREQSLSPLEVTEISQQEKPGSRTRISRRVTPLELALITRQLATLLESGLPLEQVLNDVARQSGKPHIERILLAVRARVREGHSLAAGLSEFPKVFPELYIKTVDAGEQSGHLDIILERLADYTESKHQIRQKTLLALFYPGILTGMALLIVGALLAYVVPQVVQVFENVDQELPIITSILISISDFSREFGIYLVLLILISAYAFKQLLKKESTQLAWHRTLLKLPLLGKMTRNLNAARFARTLSILSSSSVPILEALRISAQVVSCLPMRAAVEEAAAIVREGGSLHSALEKTGYFPPMTVSLIASGESSGKLHEMLERAATIQERETETTITALLGIFEPVLILIMGALVLFIVIAILLPIFELNQLVA